MGTVFHTTTDPSELLGPEPRWLSHDRFAVWSAGAAFVGWTLWGHVADDDAERGKQLWISLAARIVPPYDFVLDLGRLDSISAGAYVRIREFAMTRKPGLRRMAVLVGEETSGGVIQLGLYVLRPPEFEWRSFLDRGEAAAWLDRPGAAAVLEAAHDRIGTRTVETSPLARLRGLLGAAPDATIETVARGLGQSPRSLQRAMVEWGTTFSAERDRARVLRAQELLREPEAKLEAVAAAVGCADRRTLNRLFRRVTGESPADFRARRGLGSRRSS